MNNKLWNRDYIFLLLTTFCAAVIHSSFIAVFPLFVNEIGGNNAVTGAMMSGLVLTGLITRIICGQLMDRYGRKKILIIGSILFSINTFAYYFVVNIPGLFFLRMFNGISQGFYFGAAGTLVADITPKERLIDGIGFFGISASLAAAVSPSIGLEIYNHFGSRNLFLLIALFSLVGVLFAFLIGNHYGLPNKKKLKEKFVVPKLKDLIELAVFIPSIIAFLIYFGNSAVANFITVYGLERGITNISIFFLINNITIIIVRLLTGRLVKKIKEIYLITIGCLLIISALFLIAFSYNITYIIIAAILLGGGISLSAQLLNASVYRFISDERRGVGSSTYSLFTDLGNGLGATFFGSISVKFNYTFTYIIAGCFVIVALVVSILKLKPKLDNKAEEIY